MTKRRIAYCAPSEGWSGLKSVFGFAPSGCYNQSVMSEDAELLSRYVRDRSEAAFAGLVERHLPLVYSAALRQGNGNLELAKDVAQTVFIDLNGLNPYEP